MEDSDKVFDEMIRSVEKCHSDVKRLIRSQEKAAVGQAEEQVDQLQKEISELRRRDTELEQLSKTEDFIIFLQVILALTRLLGAMTLVTNYDFGAKFTRNAPGTFFHFESDRTQDPTCVCVCVCLEMSICPSPPWIWRHIQHQCESAGVF